MPLVSIFVVPRNTCYAGIQSLRRQLASIKGAAQRLESASSSSEILSLFLVSNRIMSFNSLLLLAVSVEIHFKIGSYEIKIRCIISSYLHLQVGLRCSKLGGNRWWAQKWWSNWSCCRRISGTKRLHQIHRKHILKLWYYCDYFVISQMNNRECNWFLLKVLFKRTSDNSNLCSGTLIKPNKVLTNAFCAKK